MRIAQIHAVILSAFVGLLGANFSLAQNYPTKPIRIHTAGAGGTSDTVSRVLADDLAAALGQPLIVENFAGTVLVPNASKVAPDGYTLLITGNNLWVAPLFQEMPYNPIKDFTPIVTLTRQSTILVVHPSLPAKTVAELVKGAKNKPGELNYSSGTTGSSSQIAAELFNSLAGTNIIRVTYKATAQEMSDLLSGRIHLTFGNGPTMGPLVQAGKVRALATAGSRRSVLFPDLPTIAETVPGYVSEQLVGIFVPAKTSDAIVRRINQVAVRAIEKSDIHDRLLKNGLEPVGGSPEQFLDAIKSDMVRIGRTIKDAGVRTGS